MTPSPIPTSALQADPSASFHASIIAPETVCERAQETDSGVGQVRLSHERELEPMEEQLVAMLQSGWVSAQDSLRQIGLYSLSQRVSELKREHGFLIVDEWRQVGRSRFKVYKLAGGAA
jgi:hypothetical protein